MAVMPPDYALLNLKMPQCHVREADFREIHIPVRSWRAMNQMDTTDGLKVLALQGIYILCFWIDRTRPRLGLHHCHAGVQHIGCTFRLV